MDSLATRLKRRFRTPASKDKTPPPQLLDLPARPSTATPTSKTSIALPPRTRRFSLFPSPSKVRSTFADKEGEDQALGVIESPQRSPETPYSGVPKIGEVEVVQRVAKGEVKQFVVGEGNEGVVKEVVGRGKAADGGAAVAFAGSAVGIGYSRAAGLLFSPELKNQAAESPASSGVEQMTISFTETQMRKLREAIAAERDLGHLQQRTQREVKLLDAFQSTLDAQLQPLEELFFAGKSAQENGSGDIEEFAAIERGIEKIRGKVADAEHEKAAVESRLGGARERREVALSAVLGVLASVLGGEELGSEGAEERMREEGFAKKYRVPESFLWV